MYTGLYGIRDNVIRRLLIAFLMPQQYFCRRVCRKAGDLLLPMIRVNRQVTSRAISDVAMSTFVAYFWIASRHLSEIGHVGSLF
jgi:hypothetical protein